MAAAAALSIDGDNAHAVIDVGQLGKAPAPGGAGDEEAAASLKLQRALAVVGFLTGATAVAAAVYRSPPAGTFLARGGGFGYYVALGGAFAAGVAEVWAALWMAEDVPDRRPATGKKILCAAAVPLLLIVALGGFAAHVKK